MAAGELFSQERPKLLDVLGEAADGGAVERIEWIGSSNVPGLTGSGRVDIGLAVWPFPVEGDKLSALGYRPTGEDTDDLQRFADPGGRVQLWIANAESGFVDQAVLMRDYLRENEAARQAFNARRVEKAEFFRRILPEAQRWWVERTGFGPLEAVAAEFTGEQTAAFDWTIASGWAIDLFLGRVTRVHRDVDVVVPFNQQSALQEHLLGRGWRLLSPLDGKMDPWPRHMQIQLPRHQAHARRGDVVIDVLFTPIENGVWRYRRNPAILRSTGQMSLTGWGGIPYLAPEIVLLFKSKNTGARARPQDQADFDLAAPLLEPERRAWLRWALAASDPDNPWLRAL